MVRCERAIYRGESCLRRGFVVAIGGYDCRGMKFALAMLPLSLFFASCGNGPPVRNDAVMVVKEVRIPKDEPLVARFARHTWLDYRENLDANWRRIEIVNVNSGLIHRDLKPGEFEEKPRWGETVVVLGQSDGKANPDYFNDIAKVDQSVDASVYRAYPGPNSNTFATHLIREVDGISAVLDHNAMGKEWGFYLGRTTGGTGAKIQTPLVGLALGLKEGIEVSFLGFSGGISFYPPALKIPVLPPLPRW